MLLRKPLGDDLGIYDYEDEAVPHLNKALEEKQGFK